MAAGAILFQQVGELANEVRLVNGQYADQPVVPKLRLVDEDVAEPVGEVLVGGPQQVGLAKVLVPPHLMKLQTARRVLALPLVVGPARLHPRMTQPQGLDQDLAHRTVTAPPADGRIGGSPRSGRG